MIGEKGQSQRQDELISEWVKYYNLLITEVNKLKKEDNHTARLARTLQIIRIVIKLSDIC